MIIRDMILKLEDSGYSKQDARARVCQDIVLKAISQSVFSNNVTIKVQLINVNRKMKKMLILFSD